MNVKNVAVWFVCVLFVIAMVGLPHARAAVIIDTVAIGHANNADDNTGFGGVPYTYDIGKYEVTTGQYASFLNAVAKKDTYALYNTSMFGVEGAGIVRGGSSGSYTYNVLPGYEDRPVNYVSWGGAARFANWMHNGQPLGSQDLSTTEDGSYLLNGATTQAQLIAVAREADATWVLPTVDEWYKAAYFNGISYTDYPTNSDTAPSNLLTNPDPGNNANFNQGSQTLGSPYYRTEVGEFENSESGSGTFDQGGNVWEWNEGVYSGTKRGFRGGSYLYGVAYLKSNFAFSQNPSASYKDVGFRLVQLPMQNVPEPATMSLMGLLAVGLVRRRRRV